MESTFFERWLESVMFFVPGLIVCALIGAYMLYADHVRDTRFEEGRARALDACLEDRGLLTCEAALEKRHQQCAEDAYRSSDKFSGLRFDNGSYERCVFKHLDSIDR